MRVCLDLLNGPCLAANIDALGMMAMMAKGRPAWLDDGIALSVAGAPVMTKALADDPQALAKVYLRMGELAQRRLTLSLATVEGKDPVAEAKRWRMAGSDLAAADRWYGEAIRLLADIGGPDAPRMRLAAKLNRADLAEIAGEGRRRPPCADRWWKREPPSVSTNRSGAPLPSWRWSPTNPTRWSIKRSNGSWPPLSGPSAATDSKPIWR